ncbi:hypothetical protein [Motiliproteus sediminis]|uniref:hypothetical protein n=1 Tax=Motiliproteus sediminis TaxID=1468178 RepID=UPI001AEF594C|nr:hypothetical protein [Motiliproteus sediminis]
MKRRGDLSLSPLAVALGLVLIGGCQSAPPPAPTANPVPAKEGVNAAPTEQQNSASGATLSITQPPSTPAGPTPATAASAAPKVQAPQYDNAKADFAYGSGQPWPRLTLPALLLPGPLPAAPGAPTLPLPPIASADDDAQGQVLAGAPAPDPAARVQSPCAGPWAAQSLVIGPKEGWFSGAVQSMGNALIGKVLGGFGPFDGVEDEPDAPPTVKDPIPKSARQHFEDDLSDIELSLAGRLDDDGLLISAHIDDAPDDSTFHAIYLEDKSCQRQFPDRYLNYRIWLEWSLSVSWSKTERHYENDQLVSEKTTSGSSFDSGVIDLAEGSTNLNAADMAELDQYQRDLLQQLPPPIWQQLGFSGPTAGVRGLGTQFNRVDPEALFRGDNIAVLHLTRVVGDRYVTRALPFRLSRGAGNLVSFTRL